MGIVRKAFDSIRDILGAGPGSPLADGYTPEWGISYRRATPAEVNGTFVACLHQLSRGISSGTLQVKYDGEVVLDHPLTLLWTPELIGPMIERLYATNSGTSFIHKIRVAGQVGMLVPLTCELKLRNGVYVDEATDKVYSRNDIIPIKLHPAPWRALSFLVGTDLEYSSWARDVIENNANPGILVSPEDGGSFSDIDQLKLQRNFTQWKEKRGGTVLSPVKANLQQLSLSPEELDIYSVQLGLRGQICSLMDVPSPLIGLEPATYANYETSRKVFMEGTIPYLGCLVACSFEEYLLPEFGDNLDGKYTIEFDFTDHPALQEELRYREKQLMSEVNAGLRTKDEWREMHGLDPLPEEPIEEEPKDGNPFGQRKPNGR